MRDLIVSFPDHCLSLYFLYYFDTLNHGANRGFVPSGHLH